MSYVPLGPESDGIDLLAAVRSTDSSPVIKRVLRQDIRGEGRRAAADGGGGLRLLLLPLRL